MPGLSAAGLRVHGSVSSFCRGTEEPGDGWNMMLPGLGEVSLSSSLW